MILCGASAMAQPDIDDSRYAKWGADSAEREQNLRASQLLKEEITNRNYDEASRLLCQLIAGCPAASENIYVYGATLYKNRINRSKTQPEKNTYIDSLMWLYDKRVESFGSHPERGESYILERKAAEYLAYRPGDRAGIRQAFRAAIEAGGTGANPEIVVVYFTNLCADYKNTGEIMPGEVISEYRRLSPIFAANSEADDYRSRFDAEFVMSGAASCETLEKFFSAKLEANPRDDALLAQAVSLMSRAKCGGTFFFAIADRYYNANPSTQAALFLAQALQSKGDYAKADEYLHAALTVERDLSARERLLVRIALVALADNDADGAADAARKARDLDPEDGVPHFLLAQSYAASVARCPGVEGQAAFWAAYDAMARAVELLPQESEYYQPARISMTAYRNRFPSSEECFFNELKEGAHYTITCGTASGIVTTVRPK